MSPIYVSGQFTSGGSGRAALERIVKAGTMPNSRDSLDFRSCSPPPFNHRVNLPESRIEVLEHRVQELEQQVQRLLNRPEAPRAKRPSRRAERTTGPLKRNLVSLASFAQLHSVTETKVQAHVDISLLPVKRGKWTDRDGTVVTLALDTKGRQAFYQLYQELPSFLECPQCPHGYLDTV